MSAEFSFEHENVLAFFNPLPGSPTIAPTTIKHISVWPDGNISVYSIGTTGGTSTIIAGYIVSLQQKDTYCYTLTTSKYVLTISGMTGSDRFRSFAAACQTIIDNKKAPGRAGSASAPTVRAELFLRHNISGLRNAIAALVRLQHPSQQDGQVLFMTDLRLYSYIFQVLVFIRGKGQWWAEGNNQKQQTLHNSAFEIYTLLCSEGLITSQSKCYLFKTIDEFCCLINYFVTADHAYQSYSALDTLSATMETLLQRNAEDYRQYAHDFHTATIELAILLIDIDGIRTKEELAALEDLKLLHPKQRREVASLQPSEDAKEIGTELTVEDCIAELDELIGLEGVKEHVKEIMYVQSNNQKRIEAGLKPVQTSHHMVFTGNPGTGKTTVARIIGRIYRSLGLLSKGHFIEATKSDIVAGYIGQTAIKMKEILNAAKGGILFIDEAYSLIQGNDIGDQFGKEAINEMLKYMEDNREDIVVIAAGYEKEMSGFISSNPGLRSRFLHFINFPDYEVAEMLEILSLLMNRYDLVFGCEADKMHYLDCLLTLRSKATEGFGNARTVRSLFEKAMRNQARRLQEDLGRINTNNHVLSRTHALQTLTATDMPKKDLVAIF